MSNITQIWLFVQTSSGTTANLALIVNRTTGNPLALFTQSQQGSTNGITTAGTTAQFSWKEGGAVGSFWPVGMLTTNNLASFTLGIAGSNTDDAWIPSSIWVVYRTDTGAYTLGPQHPSWPQNQCFSSQTSDCGGKAKPTWPLSWNQLDPIVVFDAGGITETQLEPSESATYTFVVSNVSLTTTISSMVLGLQCDLAQFTADGVAFGVAVGSSGLPEINVTALIPPGGSTPVSFAIYTTNAKVQKYTFGVKLLGLTAATGENSSLSVDKTHAFTVVAS